MKSRLLAYAQLMRLPNVFTAFADVLLGWTVAGESFNSFTPLGLLLLATGCLYSAGMALNDYFDRKEDAKTRPTRPIPSGRVEPEEALVLGIVLLIAGVIAAVFTGNFVGTTGYPSGVMCPPVAAILIAISVLMYDTWIKHTTFGPVGMGLCRFFNVVLGFSVANPRPFPDELMWHSAATVGLYIVGVTWFARTEEGESRRRHLVYATLVMLAALGLAVTVPVHLSPGTSFVFFPYLVVAFGFYVGLPISRAIQKPGPKQVQAAVKRCILGLVVLDAVLASAFVGPAGLLLVLLLLPASWLGKWVYST
ncbi:MAG TPA: UbiA family prenyltransferase [Fimbriiglobus sp.]|jgi:4-hydroxybenzoate polyprenyltransferase